MLNWFERKSKISKGSDSAVVPRHLTYDSLEAWSEGERLPKDWMTYADVVQRNLWWEQFVELKTQLWSQHIATLTDEEQKEFKARTHPSLSHAFEERAVPFTNLLKEELARRGYNAQVRLGLYHGDRIVLSTKLDRTPLDRTRGLPWLFRGFEVKYGFPDAA